MKTKKFSNLKKAFMAIAMTFIVSGFAFSQTVEERKGGSSTYSVTAGALTDEYTWTIAADVAPASVSVAGTGTGTIADPYVIPWTADLTSIDVTWGADASPDIASSAGTVSVQKRTNAGAVCPSVLQVMNISFWSNPTAGIDPGSTDLTVCSADAIGGTITINLTGAPDAGQSGTDGFEVLYDVAAEGTMTVNGGAEASVGTGKSVTSDGATVTIDLPTDLVNIEAVPRDYTITLTSVQDDFNEGLVAVAGEVFTITVNPVPVTGPITSDGALTRR